MNQPRLAGLFSLSLLAAPLAPAQPSDEPNPAFDILSRDAAEWSVPKNQVTFGFRVLSNGVEVNFGGLGNVPSIRTLAPLSEGVATRRYDNGVIVKDELRSYEKDSAGNQISVPGTRFISTVDNGDGTTSVSSDVLAYTPGQTRVWSFLKDSQVLPGNRIGMSTYSATSEGASRTKDQGPTAGVEFQLARTLGNLSRRVQWSLVAGVALSDINHKVGGTVASTLNIHTDVYQVNGFVPSAPYVGPTFTDLVATNGITYTEGLETTPPLSALPVSSSDTSIAGGASVLGNWQVKGAYFLMRLGPSIRTQLTERIGLSASVGVAGAFAGSRYSVVETLELPDVSDPITTVEEDTESKLLSGLYADVNVDLMINERTGLYGGVSVQQFGDYDQAVGGRTARIDLGNSVGIRGGISIKF